ncbi:tetratricopeptide repeat protein [Candidatus Neomarinimicrobiota bacterium]
MIKRFGILVLCLVCIPAGTMVAQDLDSILEQARLNIASQDYDTAMKQLEEIIEQSSAFAPAHFELSKLALILDDLKTAQSSMEAALENDPRNEEYRAEAEKLAAISSSMSDAARAYSDREYLDAVAIYEKIVEEYPTFASAYYGMGKALTQAEMLRQAANAFRQAIEHNPRNEEYSSSLLYIVGMKFNDGNNNYRDRNWEAALESYQEAIDIDASFHQSHLMLARVYQRLDDYASAMAALDRVLAIKPDYVNAYIEKGKLLKREGRTAEAEAAYRLALSVDPNSTNSLVGLGSILMSDRPDEAIVTFKAALKIDAKDGDAAEYLGELYSIREEWAEAKRYLEQAVRLKPRDHVTAWRLAQVYNQMKDYENARQMAKKSTDISKTFQYGWYEKGLAEKALGNRVAAIEAFRNALKGRDAGIRKGADYELKQLESPGS